MEKIKNFLKLFLFGIWSLINMTGLFILHIIPLLFGVTIYNLKISNGKVTTIIFIFSLISWAILTYIFVF